MSLLTKIMGIIGSVIVGIILLPFSPIIFVFSYVKGAKETIKKWNNKIVDINDHKGE